MTEKEASDYLLSLGYGVTHPSQYIIDMEKEYLEIWKKSSPYTMISIERGYSIFKSIEYIKDNEINGDFAECGVWKGGSCMIAAFSLMHFGINNRKIFLYDTFSGMTEPSDNDCIASSGENIYRRWEKSREDDGSYMWASSLEEVKSNMSSTGYDKDNLVYVAGDVRETLENVKPESLSLLRLDTDWYDSTKAELEHLYPLLSEKGVLIIDDYGHFTGSRKAVDEFFRKNGRLLLNRSDYTGRTAVKI